MEMPENLGMFRTIVYKQEILMRIRINVNSVKNAMGTVFLLAATFFVCSTLVSMRSVFADPIATDNAIVRTTGRTSPRATQNKRVNVSRATVSRASGAVTPSKSKAATSRGVGTRSVSSRSITPTRSKSVATRNVSARSNAGNRTTSNNRAVRARSATTPSRVSATGSVMSGTRVSSSVTYLSNKLYTGTYSNIIDSTTGLISADAYSNCMESYYTCMDEICTARSDTKGRCSCAGRAVNFLESEELLEKANEELIKLSGQLSLLIATKGKGDALASAFSLTDAEKVLNCVSYKEATDKAQWCEEHPTFTNTGEVAACAMPSYCKEKGNSFGFDISNIDGSSSDILSQLKAWADAKDLAKDYTSDNENDLWANYTTISGVVNGMTGITTEIDESKASLDKLANKWGYDLFQYAHNNVCGRVLDSCFNGIYEACGTPKSITEKDVTVRVKCGNGQTSNCPFNYNSYVSVKTSDDGKTASGEIELSDSSSTNATLSSSATCFGYASTSTGVRTTTSTSSDPYAQLRGPVADARRSIINKYLLDANAACDAYGAALKKTAQNINYQKIAAEQALQQKRLEFKQEADNKAFADASTAIDNFNECISEIWDCYDEYSNEEKWTTARIKAYCSQVSQVPHCYETMICSPLQTQLTAVVDQPDSDKCVLSNDYNKTTCRNVVTINEILYGTGATASDAAINWNNIGEITGVNSAGVREMCLERALGCGKNAESLGSDETAYCLRRWNKTDKGQVATTVTSIADSNLYSSYVECPVSDIPHAVSGLKIDGQCKVTECADPFVPDQYGTACECKSGSVLDGNTCVQFLQSCTKANATVANRTYNVETHSYGDCVAMGCSTGYTLSNGQCVQGSN